MQRKIGPLPLTSGLQLGAPEGKPTGLLRALNVEARDGYLQRRRGCTDLVEIMPPVNGGSGGAGAYFPASWAGQSVIYFDVGEPAGNLAPASRSDFICRVAIGGDGPGTIVANEALGDAELTFDFWGADDAWHTLDVLPLSHVRTGNFISTQVSLDENSNSGGGAMLVFIYPAGFKTAQPAGTPYSSRWIRMTRSAGTWSLSAALEVWRFPNGAAPDQPASAFRAAMIAPTTRTHAKPWVACVTEVNTPAYWSIGAVDTSVYAWLNFGTRQAVATEEDRPQLLYMPATDHIFAALGASYVKIPAADDTAAAIFTPEIPDPDLSPYGDIPCRTALPERPAAACVFGGRPFLAGFALDPQRIIWGAPNEWWTVWPESNDARIADAGGGKIIALIPADEVLYVFTTVGIWRATLTDPEGKNESNLFIDLVEEVRCTAPASIINSPYGILFLASDGPRRFDGRRSKRLSDDIDELFRPDGGHAFPCLDHDSAVGVFHPLENQYRISYRSPGAFANDTELVIDMEGRAAWLHGADLVSAIDAAGQATANEPIGQRPWGQRWHAACWVPSDKRIWTVHPEGGIVALDDGDKDCGHRLPWYAETQHLRIAAAEQAVMEKVEVVVARDHFQPVRVSVIPDGDRARTDSRDVAVQRDRLSTSAAIDSQSLAGNITPLQLDESLSPLVWRGRKKARNHRVKIEGISPTHHPARILSVTAHLSVEKESR